MNKQKIIIFVLGLMSFLFCQFKITQELCVIECANEPFYLKLSFFVVSFIILGCLHSGAVVALDDAISGWSKWIRKK